jgi:hypothetical protein
MEVVTTEYQAKLKNALAIHEVLFSNWPQITHSGFTVSNFSAIICINNTSYPLAAYDKTTVIVIDVIAITYYSQEFNINIIMVTAS